MAQQQLPDGEQPADRSQHPAEPPDRIGAPRERRVLGARAAGRSGQISVSQNVEEILRRSMSSAAAITDAEQQAKRHGQLLNSAGGADLGSESVMPDAWA